MKKSKINHLQVLTLLILLVGVLVNLFCDVPEDPIVEDTGYKKEYYGSLWGYLYVFIISTRLLFNVI